MAAGRIKGITVEIGGDTTKLQTALKGVISEIKSTQAQLKDVEKLLKLDPGNTELLAQKQKLLSSAIEETKEKLTTLKTAAEHASELIKRACLAQKRLTTTPLVLHSDNGSPMKGSTMLETLYALGITPSNSRPRVSNDNPYSESLFRTLKYRPNYQPKGFDTIESARGWCARFVKWYRFEHHHSGIQFLTPAERHNGKGALILQKRHNVYEAAKAQHPERWGSRSTRNWSEITEVHLNPDKVAETTEITLESSEANAS